MLYCDYHQKDTKQKSSLYGVFITVVVFGISDCAIGIGQCLAEQSNGTTRYVYQSFFTQLYTAYVLGLCPIVNLNWRAGVDEPISQYSGDVPAVYVEPIDREDRRVGRRTWTAIVLILVAIPLVIFFGIFFLNDRSNVFIGICIICLAMLPFAMIFENRKPQARELLVIAVMAAIAVAGRMAFFMIPQFKPVCAVVIIAGIGLGAEAGFLTGAVSGFVSNFFFGQGP